MKWWASTVLFLWVILGIGSLGELTTLDPGITMTHIANTLNVTVGFVALCVLTVMSIKNN